MLKQDVDAIVEPLLAKRKNLGLVIGVIEDNIRSIFGYGKIRNDANLPPDGKTVFEIGSVTKVLTTTLLAKMSNAGLVSLNEPAHELLPNEVRLPSSITLLRLATHTSGLPRLPRNFIWSYLRNPRNPYAEYRLGHLRAYLAHYKHKLEREGTFRYSNLGMGLLGYLLARRLGCSYEEAIKQWICEPLGMCDTSMTLNPSQHKRLAQAHSSWGTTTQNWDVPALAGAGGLRSTGNDLLSFLAGHLGQTEAFKPEELKICHKLYINGPSPLAGIGLGWMVSRLGDSDHELYWHNGATRGYSAYVGFVKEQTIGVVILSNHGIGLYDLLLAPRSVNDIGARILQHLVAVPA